MENFLKFKFDFEEVIKAIEEMMKKKKILPKEVKNMQKYIGEYVVDTFLTKMLTFLLFIF